MKLAGWSIVSDLAVASSVTTVAGRCFGTIGSELKRYSAKLPQYWCGTVLFRAAEKKLDRRTLEQDEERPVHGQIRCSRRDRSAGGSFPTSRK